jgi:catechol 2,3-dioxygenase-like lactoylglutathione lyase family enzyme
VNYLHHVHIFATDINTSIDFYREFFQAEVVLDAELAGARNVFLRIGTGRLHLYEQPPKREGAGSIHHFGIQTDDLEAAVKKLKNRGAVFKKNITDFGFWKYIMVPAPDGILIELFQVDKKLLPPEYAGYFSNKGSNL